MDLIVQGKPGRDEQIEHYKTCIRAMGDAGIPVLCAKRDKEWRLPGIENLYP